MDCHSAGSQSLRDLEKLPRTGAIVDGVVDVFEVILRRYTFLVAQLCIEAVDSTEGLIFDWLEADELLGVFAQGLFFVFFVPMSM